MTIKLYNGTTFKGRTEVTKPTPAVIPKNEWVVEVAGHLSDNSCVINEIEILDSNSDLIGITVGDAYDLVRNGVPGYWNNISIWNKDNLTDGNTNYQDTSSGAFLHPSSANDTSLWTRISIAKNSEEEAAFLRFYLGAPNGRVPMELRIYSVLDTLSTSNINARDNTGLSLVYEKTDFIQSEWTTSQSLLVTL